MPEIICEKCKKAFMASNSNKKYCGCHLRPMSFWKFNPKKFKKEKEIKMEKTKKISKISKAKAIRYIANQAIKLLNIPREKCSECNRKKKLCIHHIDKNVENNLRENLQVLCRKCHRLKHPDLPDKLFIDLC
jgi:5-methylcytosine-specific restriction endonuclease McrA